jgi:hypothetical protein
MRLRGEKDSVSQVCRKLCRKFVASSKPGVKGASPFPGGDVGKVIGIPFRLQDALGL